SPAVLRALVEHSWPGNVRELANAVERLVLLAEDGRARLEDLPPEVAGHADVGRSRGGGRFPRPRGAAAGAGLQGVPLPPREARSRHQRRLRPPPSFGSDLPK